MGWTGLKYEIRSGLPFFLCNGAAIEKWRVADISQLTLILFIFSYLQSAR